MNLHKLFTKSFIPFRNTWKWKRTLTKSMNSIAEKSLPWQELAPGHNIISVNIIVALGVTLKGKSCQPYGSDMRIHVPQNSLFTYPDISILYGEVVTSNEDDETVTQPMVIMEILSASTRNYDRGESFCYTATSLHRKNTFLLMPPQYMQNIIVSISTNAGNLNNPEPSGKQCFLL